MIAAIAAFLAKMSGLFGPVLRIISIGTCRKVPKERLQRCADESAGRHNAKQKDTADMIAAQTRNMAGKRLTYEDLTDEAA